MSQVIKSKGLRVLFAGSLQDYTHQEAWAALRLAEGKVCFEAKKTFDVAVVGRRPGKKDMEIIESRKKPCLGEDQFKRLVQFGELDLDAGEPEEEQSMGEAVGDLRGLFDGEPSPQMWRDIVAVLDRTEPERLSEVVAYVEGHISRWPIDEARRWHASLIQAALPDSGSWIAGDLRVMPTHWLEQLLRGEDSEKFSLVRALSLEGTKANTSAASKIFASSHLHNVRHLDCGRDLKLTPTFYKKLAQYEGMKQLETLIYYPYKKSGAGAELAKGKHFTALKHLKLRYADYGISHDEGKKDLQDLLAADWIGQVESLESTMSGSPKVSCSSALFKEDVLGAYGERLTGLKRLIAGDAVGPQHSDPYKETLRRIEVLALVGRARRREGAFAMLDAFAELEGKALHTVDLSQLMLFDDDRDPYEQNPLIDRFVAHPIVSQIERVCVSEYATRKTLERLENLEGVTVITV